MNTEERREAILEILDEVNDWSIDELRNFVQRNIEQGLWPASDQILLKVRNQVRERRQS